jgi:hypothetical protein
MVGRAREGGERWLSEKIARREARYLLTEKELENNPGKVERVFKDYGEHFPYGRVLLLPVVLDKGRSIRWTVCVHAKNAVGPLRLTEETAKEIGAPLGVIDAARIVQERLQKRFPSYPYRKPEAVGLIRREMGRLLEEYR